MTDDQYESVREFFRTNDKLARFMNIELAEVGDGYARAEMVLRPEHMNGANIAHGGTLFTLADFAFGAAANSDGVMSIGINGSISFIKPGISGKLTAEARRVSANHKLATYHVNISDEAGESLASFQGTVYRKKERIV